MAANEGTHEMYTNLTVKEGARNNKLDKFVESISQLKGLLCVWHIYPHLSAFILIVFDLLRLLLQLSGFLTIASNQWDANPAKKETNMTRYGTTRSKWE